MKKVLLALWPILVVALGTVIFLKIRSIQNQHKHCCEYHASNPQREMYDIFSTSKMESLLARNPYAIISVAIDGCSSCDIFYSSHEPERFPVSRAVFKIEHDPANLLLSEALHVVGFPTTFIVDENKDIIGFFEGANNITANLDSIINRECKVVSDDYMPEMNEEDVLLSLSARFKSLLCYLDEDIHTARSHALRSLSYGDNFFGNYILYDFHMRTDAASDSTAYYKVAALNCINGVRDALIYRNIITDLDSLNTFLLDANKILNSMNTDNSHKHLH